MPQEIPSDSKMLESFIKASQYLAGIETSEDVYQKIIDATRLLPGLGWAGLLRVPTDSSGKFHICSPPTENCPCLSEDFPAILRAANRVHASSFLETLPNHAPEVPLIVILPMMQGGEVPEVLVLGLNMAGPLPAKALNFLLGFAGVASQARGHWLAEHRLRTQSELLFDQVSTQALDLEATSRKLAEQQEFARIVLENLDVGVMVCDAEGQLILFNRVSRSWHGLDPTDIPAEKWAEYYSLYEGDGTTPLAKDNNPLYRGWKGEVVRDCAMAIKAAGQATRFIQASATPIHGPDGSFLGAVVITNDITARLKADKELRLANHKLQELLTRSEELTRRAEEATIAKSQFLANMSHELRTPMNGVLGMAELLLTTSLNPEQKEYLRTLESSGKSLLSLINDILDFSKIEAGQLDLEFIPFAPKEIKDRLEDMFLHEASRKGLNLRFEGWDGLPARLQGDPQRLCQILANLISNALKFTKEGEVRVLAGREAGTENWVLLHFHIRDTGMGIPPEKQGLLFEKFSQLDSSYTRKFGGTGLGLAISKQLVDLMGGEIGVVSPIISENSASSPRPGSDFWFTARVSACASPVGSATGPIPSTLSPGSRILVVEDNPVNQKMLLMLLKKIGIETKSASDGQEALDCLGRERFDLVLMDVQMPVLDGIETTLALRSWPEDNPASHIPIVAVTAHAFPEDRRRCLEAGMNDHLAKPVSRPALEEVLRRWLPSPANSDS